jgi:hypothetical protein
MPSASPALRAKFPGGDIEATGFLTGRGWTLTKQWKWVKPTPDHEVTPEEEDAINYMFWEWDYGGIDDED